MNNFNNKNSKRNMFISFLTASVLFGCGAESTINVKEPPPKALTGKFVDSPVQGLTYNSDTVVNGTTNENGEFPYFRGEIITFSIGDFVFPSVPVASVMTPLNLFNADTAFSQPVVNTLRLLQSLDIDGDASNGITISEDAAAVATMTLAPDQTIEQYFNRPADEFAADVETWLPAAGGAASLVSYDVAVGHFVSYLETEFGTLFGSAFNVSAFTGSVFNPAIVGQAAVLANYNFTPADDTGLTGSYTYTASDSTEVSGTYHFEFGRRVLTLTAGDEVTYLVSRSYNTVDDVYSLCVESKSDKGLASVVAACAENDDDKLNLLTFSQAQADAELVGLLEREDEVGFELIEEFSTTTADFFTSSYQSLSKELSDKPLYVKTGGSPVLDSDAGTLTLAGARFSVGNAAEDLLRQTTESDTFSTGIYNISEGFTLSFDVIAHNGAGSLSLYVDNNTTGQANSVHGAPSKFYGKDINEDNNPVGQTFTYTYVPGQDVVTGTDLTHIDARGVLDTSITNSFFQFRTDSAGSITIDNLKIDTVATAVDPSDNFIPPSKIVFEDTVDFTTATTESLFSPAFLSTSGAASETDDLALFVRTGGNVAVVDTGIELNGGRFTMGNYLPGTETTAADLLASGVLDLSRPYQIVMDIVSVSDAEGDNTFEVYVDNNTSSSANSMHGETSRIFKSNILDLAVGELVIPGNDIGTETSFLQFRTSSDGIVVFNNLRIEYIVEAPAIKVALPYSVDFTTTTTASLFTPEFAAVDGDVGLTGDDVAMFERTGGNVDVVDQGVLLDAGRFTIGDTKPEVETTADDTSTRGVFDLSRPYKIKLNVIAASNSVDGKTFQVYVDNNTSSSSKSIHGGSSKFYQVVPSELSTGELVIEGMIATSQSFLQFRTETGASIEFNNLSIEYDDPNVFYEESFPVSDRGFYTPEYRAQASDDTKGMYTKTGGTAVVTTEGTLLLDSARFTIGDVAQGVSSTNAADVVTTGSFDFSKPYKIVMDVLSVSEPVAEDQGNSFIIYMDNNTSSSGSSIHGGSSKFFSVKLAELTPGELEVEGFIGTPTSFLQLRTESGGVVEIDNLRFEYIPTNLIVSEDFNTTIEELFTPAYLAQPIDNSIAMYNITGGGSGLTITDGQLTLDSARFSIGHSTPDVETTGTDVLTTGVFDLSVPYKIIMDIVSVSEPIETDQGNSFIVYVDNSSSSSSKSIHGGASKFYSQKIAEMTTGQLEIDGMLATQSSFLQLRTESGGVVTIDNLRIEYLEAPDTSEVAPKTLDCTERTDLYFCDDFTSGTLDNWDINAAVGNLDGPEGSFAVVDLDGNAVMQYTAGSVGGVLATLKTSAMTSVPAADYFVEAKIRPRQNGTTANKQLFLLGRYVDDQNWYGGGINLQNSPSSTQAEVAVNLADALSRPVQVKQPFYLGERDGTDDGVWYRVRFEMVAGDLSLYINGELKGSFNDTNLTAQGLAGIFTYNRSFELDDFMIGDVANKPIQLTTDYTEASWSGAAGGVPLVLNVSALLGDGVTADKVTAITADGDIATVFVLGSTVTISPVAEGTTTVTLVSHADATITQTLEIEVGASFIESMTDYGNISTKLSPLPASFSQHVDTNLVIEFDTAPTLGTVGQVRIFDSATDELVDELLLAGDVNTLGLTSDKTRVVKYHPMRVEGNKLVLTPSSGALDYNKEYYVVIGNDVANGTTLNGIDFDGLGKEAGWTFSTRSTQPSGTELVVDDDGAADFRTLQGALDYAMTDKDTPMTITIKDGVYNEMLFLRNKNNLTIQGESRENTIVQYDNFDGFNGGSSGRPVFLVESADMLVLNNFTLKNTHMRQGSGDQAETIYFNSSYRLVANNMNFISEQDTLLMKGYAWFYNCLVAGNVDFIWGYPVATLFENSEIRTIGDSKDAPADSGGDYILQARVANVDDPGFVFLNNTFTSGPGPKGNNVLDDSIYFARSAGKTDAFDNIVLINNRLGAHISTKGWYTNPMPNPSDASAVAGWREYGSMDLEGNSLDISGREANVAFELSAPEAAPYSDRASVFASYNGGAGWEPTPLDAPVIADVVVTTPDGDGGFGGHLMEVTGGAGGTVVTVDNGVALQNALASAKSAGTPVIIYVDGTITPANSGNLTGNINIKDLSNVSIVGVANRGEFAGIGISMRRTSNVIIQNLKIHDVPASFGDAIGIEGDDNVATGNIWVDHNELHGNLNVGKDDYDGLFDTKAGATHVTFSHNYVHDHYKSMLNGSSDDDSGERFITYRHNYFNNLESRVPLFRYGFGHLYNNVFSNINSSGINSRMGAELLIEANVFENVQNPIVSFYSREIGFWNVRDNAFTNVTYTTPDTGDAVYSPADGSTSTYEVPYDYDTYLLPVADVKDYVLANVGVGIVDQSELDIPDVADPIVDGGNDDPVVYAVLPITEDFEVASADILFSNAYKNLSGSAGSGTAMYHKVTGTVSVADGQLTITGARVSIGNTTPGINTTAADTETTGIFDLSKPYQVTFTVASVADDTSRNFQLYVDNTTSSSGSSIHGGSSKFYSVALSDFVAGQTYTIDGLVATSTSFITLRSEGGATISLEDISITYKD